MRLQCRTFCACRSHDPIDEELQVLDIFLAAARKSLSKVVHRDAVNASNGLQRVGESRYIISYSNEIGRDVRALADIRLAYSQQNRCLDLRKSEEPIEQCAKQ